MSFFKLDCVDKQITFQDNVYLRGEGMPTDILMKFRIKTNGFIDFLIYLFYFSADKFIGVQFESASVLNNMKLY